MVLLSACSPTVAPYQQPPAARPSETVTAAGRSPTAQPDAGSADLSAAHSGERAFEHVRALADGVGPRVAGSPGEAEAASYIRDYLEGLGYEVETRQFTFETDRFRPAEVRVGDTTFEAATIEGSPAGSPAGPLRYVELGDEQGIAGQDLAGAIAVAGRGGLRFVEKARAAAMAGAIGLIVVNDEPGLISGELGDESPIPVIGIAQEDGPALLAEAAVGREALLVVEGESTRAVNVIAEAPGNGDCDVLVGGHFDTVPGVPGANDNASGTANVLELARALAADGLDEGLCFVAFGAEESGLNGSEALVSELEQAGALPRYMVNLDVTGIGDEVEIIAADRSLAGRALAAAEASGVPAVRSQVAAGTSSDHASFEAAGVPTVYYTSGDYATIHTVADVAAAIDVQVLDRVGDAAYALIRDLLAEVAADG